MEVSLRDNSSYRFRKLSPFPGSNPYRCCTFEKEKRYSSESSPDESKRIRSILMKKPLLYVLRPTLPQYSTNPDGGESPPPAAGRAPRQAKGKKGARQGDRRHHHQCFSGLKVALVDQAGDQQKAE